MNKIEILYATNRNYLTITLASILSLANNSQLHQEEPITVHLMTEGLQEEDNELIQTFKEICPNIKLIEYPLEEFNIGKYGIPEWQNTQVANARLFFQDVLGDRTKEIDRLLYLDADTIVVGDLTSLKRKQNPIYAVEDNTPTEYAINLGVTEYFNSGVLLLDVDNWRKQQYQEQIKEYIKQHQGEKMLYPDQDILNVVLDGKISKLSRAYNLPPFAYALEGRRLIQYCQKYDIPIDEILSGKETPRILHSTGLLGIKPWMINKVHPYNEIFQEYIQRVNPDYESQYPKTFKGLIAQYPRVFYTLFHLKSFLPSNLESAFRELSVKMTTNPVEQPSKQKKIGKK